MSPEGPTPGRGHVGPGAGYTEGRRSARTSPELRARPPAGLHADFSRRCAVPSARRMSPLFPLLAAALLLALRPAPGPAQARGSLVGTVVDESDGSPLEGAGVAVVESELRAEADEDGRFLLPDAPVGRLTLRVEHPGYSTVVQQVEVSRTDIAFLRVELPRLEAMLRELMVRGGRWDRSSGGSESEVRGRDDSSKTAADLLAEEVPGVEVRTALGSVGSGSAIRIRGVNSISLSNSPAIYLDGIRIDEGARQAPAARGVAALHVLQTIPADAVRSIRVVRGPSAAARYADSANGVILVETRRGDEPDDDGG